MKSFTVSTMTWLTVTEYLCHKSQSDPFLTHDLSLGLQEESEDIEGVIKIRISKNNRQHNDRKKSAKGQTTIYKNNKSNTSHDGYHMWSRNCLLFQSAWLQAWFFV